MKHNTPLITFTLSPLQAKKMRIIEQSISDPTTFRKIISGLIDVGFSAAIDELYEDGTLTDELYQKYLMLLPDFMRE
jgi:hypothetical protein